MCTIPLPEHRFEAPNIEIKLSDELEGSLRMLKVSLPLLMLYFAINVDITCPCTLKLLNRGICGNK